MSWTTASFKAAYPEFNDAPDALVAAKLADAVQLTPDEPWGALADQGAGLYTAHFLAQSPFARSMALVEGGKTLYADRLETLKRTVASGYRVTA